MAGREARGAAGPKGKEEASNRIFTVPNVISLIRLCLVPVFLVLLLNGYDLMATFLFALAAGTDWIDGQIARRTHTVSKLGQLLDPAVDRILMIAGVAGLFAGRAAASLDHPRRADARPGCSSWAARCCSSATACASPWSIPARWPPRFCSSGSPGLLLNWPLLAGLGVVRRVWLPGFAASPSPGASGSCTPGSCSALAHHGLLRRFRLREGARRPARSRSRVAGASIADGGQTPGHGGAPKPQRTGPQPAARPASGNLRFPPAKRPAAAAAAPPRPHSRKAGGPSAHASHAASAPRRAAGCALRAGGFPLLQRPLALDEGRPGHILCRRSRSPRARVRGTGAAVRARARRARGRLGRALPRRAGAPQPRGAGRGGAGSGARGRRRG